VAEANQGVNVGARRAAAVLLGLGPELAGTIFRLLGEHEVRRIAAGAKDLRKASASEVPDALLSFVESFEQGSADTAAGDELLREVAAEALGNDFARRTFDGGAPPPQPDEVLGPISQADPEALAMVLGREQPQTVALVLSSVDLSLASSVLARLPERARTAILARMATIESVAPEVLGEVGQALNVELRSIVAGGMRKVEGKNTTLEILRRSTAEQQADILGEIARGDQVLAAELRSKLFTFEDIAKLSGRDVQMLIKELDTAKLEVALKGSTPGLRDVFLKNMSTRASQMLEDDIAAMPPMKVSVVEAAQQEIAAIALRLAEEQKITIVRSTDRLV
jgi:flagellar motor switch protein FliG